MRPSVIDLREFYASPLGKRVRHSLTLAVKSLWPDLTGDTMAGLGYANPVLRSFLRQEASSKGAILSFMPAAQGAIVWPDYGANRAVLYPPRQLPMRDNQLNRLLLIHALEHSEDEEQLIAECWRVLTPGGRMLVVVPSRRSMWSRVSGSPFALGKPYTAGQLRETVCEPFTLIQLRAALAFPPFQARWLLRLSGLFERLSAIVSPMLGGVLILEVEKQLYAGLKEKRSSRSLADYVPVPAKPALSRD